MYHTTPQADWKMYALKVLYWIACGGAGIMVLFMVLVLWLTSTHRNLRIYINRPNAPADFSFELYNPEEPRHHGADDKW